MTVAFPKVAQLQTFSLAGSGITAGSTSLVLKTFTKIDGTLLAMSDFGSIGYGTLEPDNSTQEEQISFTGLSQNLSNGTCTLTGVSSISFTTPYTSTTGVQKTHAGATSFVISNTSGFFDNINAYIDQIAVVGGVPATTSTIGLVKMSFAPIDAANPIALGQNDPTVATRKFGGTGADGALTLISGITNIDCAGAQVVIKNYSSISISGTGSLTFTNPHANGTIIILKSQGNVTLASGATAAIDATGMGALGGNAGPSGAGTGARGGAGLYIECGGALNFTGLIKNNGANATAPTVQSGQNGGGGPGSTLLLYNALTANSGTSQCNAGSNSTNTTTPFSSTTSGNSGTTSIGFFNTATGGQPNGNTAGTLVYPFIYSIYSKNIGIGPGAGGGGGGLTTGPTYQNAGIGGGFGINLITLNTEFA